MNIFAIGESRIEVASHPPRSARGLHGHAFDGNLLRALASEAVGTFVLVFTIGCTAIAATLARQLAGAPSGSLAVPIAAGLALAVIVATLGHVSGAHVNPAVTVALAANRRFPIAYVPAYVAAQLMGATGAAFAAWGLLGARARSVAHLAVPLPAAGVSTWRVFEAEVIVTFILVLAIVSVATDTRVPSAVAASTIGAALAIAILVAGPVSGAGINPASVLGTEIVSGEFTDWWIYIVAPLHGAALAATVYEKFLRIGSSPEMVPSRADAYAE